MLDSHALRSWPFEEVQQTYGEKESMLYALSVGFGSDPMDLRQLPFVYERDLRAVPTMAAVLGYPGLWVSDLRTGIDWLKIVHGEQAVRFHRPLSPAATVVGLTRVTSVTDKGPGRGAIFVQERTLRDAGTGELLATVEQVNFCRGDGGYSLGGGGDGRQVSDPPQRAPHLIPGRPPDEVHETQTLPQQALMYRLNADRNPIHVRSRGCGIGGIPAANSSRARHLRRRRAGHPADLLRLGTGSTEIFAGEIHFAVFPWRKPADRDLARLLGGFVPLRFHRAQCGGFEQRVG